MEGITRKGCEMNALSLFISAMIKYFGVDSLFSMQLDVAGSRTK